MVTLKDAVCYLRRNGIYSDKQLANQNLVFSQYSVRMSEEEHEKMLRFQVARTRLKIGVLTDEDEPFMRSWQRGFLIGSSYRGYGLPALENNEWMRLGIENHYLLVRT